MSNFSQVTSYLASFHGNTVPLEDLCISITDCPHSTPKWTDNGLIVLRSHNIKGGTLDLSAPSYTDPFSFQERIKRAAPEAGDIVITREAPMGEVCLIPDGLKCCLGQRMVLLKVDSTKISSQYLLFALQSEFVQKQIRKSDRTGSTVSNLCIPDLKALEIPILLNTDGIAAILKSITGKIELNNRINSELEAMAKSLYDYWFVQFDFPDANGNPYKTSGGKMVYNPTLKREIPEGWEVVPLSSITAVSNESINPADYPEKLFKHFSIPVFDATNTFGIERGDTIGSNKFTVKDTDLLVSKLNPWFNRVVYAMGESEQICSTEFVVWRCSNAAIKNFMYMIATSPQFITHCTQSATGTSNSHKRVNPNVMMRFEHPYNLKVADKLGQHLAPIMKQLIVNQRENTKLSSLRDWLLPMLMNGQVTVGEVS